MEMDRVVVNRQGRIHQEGTSIDRADRHFVHVSTISPGRSGTSGSAPIDKRCRPGRDLAPAFIFRGFPSSERISENEDAKPACGFHRDRRVLVPPLENAPDSFISPNGSACRNRAFSAFLPGVMKSP